MATNNETPLKKVCIICAKGTIEDVYATLVMANGAVMEGIETKVFFTFFGLDAITKKQMGKIKTATVGKSGYEGSGWIALPHYSRYDSWCGSRCIGHDEEPDVQAGYSSCG